VMLRDVLQVRPNGTHMEQYADLIAAVFMEFERCNNIMALMGEPGQDRADMKEGDRGVQGQTRRFDFRPCRFADTARRLASTLAYMGGGNSEACAAWQALGAASSGEDEEGRRGGGSGTGVLYTSFIIEMCLHLQPNTTQMTTATGRQPDTSRGNTEFETIHSTAQTPTPTPTPVVIGLDLPWGGVVQVVANANAKRRL